MKPKPLEKGIAVAILIPLVIGSVDLLLNPTPKTDPKTTPSQTVPSQTTPQTPAQETASQPTNATAHTEETPPQAPPLPEAPFAHPDWTKKTLPQTLRNLSSQKVSFPKTVAKVNGKAIKGETLQRAFTEALQGEALREEDLSEEQKLFGAEALLKELVLDEILTQHIGNQTVPKEDIQKEFNKTKDYFASDTEFKEFLKTSKLTPAKLRKEIKENLAKRAWLNDQIKTPEVGPEEAKKFYEENLKDFQMPEFIKAQQIVFVVNDNETPEAIENKKRDAQKAYEKASQGGDFKTLAKELSEEPKETAGEIQFFTRDLALPQFADAAFSQEVGQVGAPVLTPLGWHVIKVLEKTPAQTKPFEEVQEDIISYIKETSQIQSQAEALKNLEKSANVEIFLSKETLYTPKPSKTEDPESTKPAQTDAPKDAPKDPSKDPEAALKAVFDTKMEVARAACLTLQTQVLEALRTQPDQYKTALAQSVSTAFGKEFKNLFERQRAADWDTIQKNHTEGYTREDLNTEISNMAKRKIHQLAGLIITTTTKTLATVPRNQPIEDVELSLTHAVFAPTM